MPMPQLQPQNPIQARPDESHERFGDFYAIQEADVQTELEIERMLFQTMTTLHNSVQINDEDDIWTLAHGTIATLEYAKNLLVKYIPRDNKFLVKVNATIKLLRDEDMDVESMIDLYSPLRDELLEIFAHLGFRRAKNPTYKWTTKIADKIQAPNIPPEILEPKKKHPRSEGSVK